MHIKPYEHPTCVCVDVEPGRKSFHLRVYVTAGEWESNVERCESVPDALCLAQSILQYLSTPNKMYKIVCDVSVTCVPINSHCLALCGVFTHQWS